MHGDEPELAPDHGQLTEEEADAPRVGFSETHRMAAAELVVEHDRAPGSRQVRQGLEAVVREAGASVQRQHGELARRRVRGRSEEHTSELQSRQYLVCRLLLATKQ